MTTQEQGGTTRTSELEDFPTLTERYQRELLAHCYRMSGSVHEAEDLVQETFLRAWKASASFQGRSSVRTWLYRIGFNCAIDFTRSRGHRETAEAPDVLDQREDPAATPTGHDVVYAGQISVQVQRALRALSDQERAAFVMRHYHQCSIDEIGRTLDLKTSAAKHAVFRAVRKMRAALRPLVTSQGEGT